jgi:hypothetical protein
MSSTVAIGINFNMLCGGSKPAGVTGGVGATTCRSNRDSSRISCISLQLRMNDVVVCTMRSGMSSMTNITISISSVVIGGVMCSSLQDGAHPAWQWRLLSVWSRHCLVVAYWMAARRSGPSIVPGRN